MLLSSGIGEIDTGIVPSPLELFKEIKNEWCTEKCPKKGIGIVEASFYSKRCKKLPLSF